MKNNGYKCIGDELKREEGNGLKREGDGLKREERNGLKGIREME